MVLKNFDLTVSTQSKAEDANFNRFYIMSSNYPCKNRALTGYFVMQYWTQAAEPLWVYRIIIDESLKTGHGNQNRNYTRWVKMENKKFEGN